MAAPVHARLRIGGQLFGDANWSIGINFSSGQSTDPFANLTLDVQGALQTWVDAVKALNTGNVLPPLARGFLSNAGTIGFIRGSRIGLDGKESAVALVEINPAPTGQDAATHSAQNCLTVSLLTGAPGASNRGRLYLPYLAGQLNNGRVPGSNTATLATQMGQWLKDLGNAANGFGGEGGVNACVASNTAGRLRRVSSVRVGNRLDTQRRRAESEKEVYSVASVPQ